MTAVTSTKQYLHTSASICMSSFMGNITKSILLGGIIGVWEAIGQTRYSY